MGFLQMSALLLLSIFSKSESSRIIGGYVVEENSIAYQASLFNRATNSHYCGGTLINVQWVLSAAHCWIPKFLMIVKLGKHNLLIKEEQNQQNFYVIRAVTNYFNYRTFDNDIMLLKLSWAVRLNNNVQLASLPSPLHYLGDTESCTVSGWGITNIYNYYLSPVLRSVTVQTVPYCKYYYWNLITDNMICAGSSRGGKDACQGDSGGPLVCYDRIEGIVSWGIGCGYSRYPGVYTRVRNYLSWIHNTIK